MKACFWIIPAVLCLAACAGAERWAKPDHTDAEVAQAYAQCELYAYQMQAGKQPAAYILQIEGQPAPGTIPPGTSRAAATGAAMGDGMGRGFAEGWERGTLQVACMKANGFTEK